MSNLFDGLERVIREMIREEITAILETRFSPVEKSTAVDREKTRTDTLIKADEVAEILDISIQRVYDLSRRREENGFPVIILGERQYRFSRERINEWLERK